jgi:hypothetical protein
MKTAETDTNEELRKLLAALRDLRPLLDQVDVEIGEWEFDPDAALAGRGPRESTLAVRHVPRADAVPEVLAMIEGYCATIEQWHEDRGDSTPAACRGLLNKTCKLLKRLQVRCLNGGRAVFFETAAYRGCTEFDHDRESAYFEPIRASVDAMTAQLDSYIDSLAGSSDCHKDGGAPEGGAVGSSATAGSYGESEKYVASLLEGANLKQVHKDYHDDAKATLEELQKCLNYDCRLSIMCLCGRLTEIILKQVVRDAGREPKEGSERGIEALKKDALAALKGGKQRVETRVSKAFDNRMEEFRTTVLSIQRYRNANVHSQSEPTFPSEQHVTHVVSSVAILVGDVLRGAYRAKDD